jgi:hypothetical protein
MGRGAQKQTRLGRPFMISEKELASGYSSVWRSLLPLGESFTRRINGHLQRFASPLVIDGGVRPALSSELGFRFFVATKNKQLTVSGRTISPTNVVEQIEHEVMEYVTRLPRDIGTEFPSNLERQDAIDLSNRIQLYLDSYEETSNVACSPVFQGCGMVDSCSGDMLVGDTLYEIKNVERAFRAVDIRQLLVYCMLERARGSLRFNNVGLLNARHGTFIKLSLDQLSFGVSGIGTIDLIDQLIQFVSIEQRSR